MNPEREIFHDTLWESVSAEQAASDLRGPGYTCRVCVRSEEWTTHAAVNAAIMWHGFEDHPEIYRAYMGHGNIPPMARPVEYGDCIMVSFRLQLP